ncbi:MAG: AraC family transcriptional regulator ligand-binding domain-containing protein [Hydrogenophaga sp.]|nr:AraC family transcriptional regulator ligand-binding domain-containing protein [Hydrogenophaga sp.]
MARELKVDAVAVMQEVGLSPGQLDNPEARVSVATGLQLLEAFAKHSGRQDVGLLMAQGRRLSSLGALGLSAALQVDLRSALQVLVARRHEFNPSLMAMLEEQGGIAVLRLDYVLPGAPYARQATERTVGVVVQLIRQFLGRDWTPRRVCFKHPPPADLRTHRKVLGWAVEFEHDFNAIVLTSQDLDTPAPLQDPALATLAKRGLQPSASERKSVAQACREHLAVLLPQGQPSAAQVAECLDLPLRTLQRRLDDEGLTFSEVLQAMRKYLLQSLLAEPGVPLSEVALRLGFSAPSAFSRWHRATFGASARSIVRKG